jgi:hypothetical protein
MTSLTSRAEPANLPARASRRPVAVTTSPAPVRPRRRGVWSVIVAGAVIVVFSAGLFLSLLTA